MVTYSKVTENANTNYQLVFNPTSMSWVSAATWCEVKDGNLVSLDSQAAILMVEWYKDNDWSAQWTSHAWTGLYSVDLNTGYWQGTCSALDYSYWATAQTYSSSSPCTYMASSDLRWYYDDCTSQHHVVCQVPNGNCNFDDQNMEVDKSFDSLDAVSLPTLDDCKNRCDGYEDGSNQCWVIKYHASSENCYLYVSANPRQYLSNKANSNRNVFYSTRDCFSASILQEPAPSASLDMQTLVKNCIETTTAGYLSTPPPETSEYQLLTTRTDNNYKSSYITTMENKDTTKSGTTINIVHKTTTALSTNKLTPETTTHMKTTEPLVTLNNGNTTQNSLRTEKPITDGFQSTTKLNKSITLSIMTSEYFTTEETLISTSQTVSNTGSVASSENTSEMDRFNTILSLSSENCVCPCDFVSKNITAEMLQNRIDELKRILTVDKTTLSSYIRKHTSAKDERPSSKAIGSMGILLLTLTICFIVLIDLSTFCQYIKCKRLKRK
ncbi:unnamed protein product [Mytilus edulis]|uniref:C-type lectin domain-containing protein n=1 Tax=Mytilus edulis TaxID=6550 RepID=A0A8S3T9V8_MYTED|nr:unnamed protein product [Mytilus edulis]